MRTIKNLRSERKVLEARITTRLFVMKFAEEKAEKDFQFAMANPNSALKSFTAEQLKVVHDGLVHYAAGGAAEAFDCLNLHGHLSDQLNS